MLRIFEHHLSLVRMPKLFTPIQKFSKTEFMNYLQVNNNSAQTVNTNYVIDLVIELL